MNGLLLALLLAPCAALGQADVRIKVVDVAEDNRFKLALPEFKPKAPADAADAALAEELHAIVRADLLYSRWFDIPETALDAAHARVEAEADDFGARFAVGVRVVDAAKGDVLMDKQFRAGKTALRPLAHRISGRIMQLLIGKDGIAHTRIAFAGGTRTHKELYLVDYDGESLTQLTRNGTLNLLPRWHPKSDRLAMTTYLSGNPDVYEFTLRTGKWEPLAQFRGMNQVGAYSPDGKRMLLTLAPTRSPNIYELDLETGKRTQLTRHTGVDSSPTYSPDGKYVAFASDRSGNPQIYILDLSTRRSRRVTSLNWADSPSWSPTGEWIVFAGRKGKLENINLYIVDVTGSNIRQLTSGEGSNEDPTWSPDGRFISFTSNRGGRRQIYIMDADGSAPHLLADIPGDSFTPAWSP